MNTATTNRALDSSATIAFLQRETGWEVVRDVLGDPGGVCYAHAANLAETFRFFFQLGGEAPAQAALQQLAAIGVVFREDLDRPLWEDVGRMIATARGARMALALGDGFGLALARRIGGDFVTADRNELQRVQPFGFCPITFIR